MKKNKKKLSDLISPIFWKTVDPFSQQEVMLFRSMAPIQISRGGRMSFKTTMNVIKVLTLLANYPYSDWIYARKKKNTIWKSVYPAIIEACQIMGWKNGIDYYANKGNVNPHTFLYFRLRNGSAIVFDGMFSEGDEKGVKPSTPGMSQFVGINYFEADQIVDGYDTIEDAKNGIQNYKASYIRDSFSKYWKEGKPFFIEMYEYNPPANKNHLMYEFEKVLMKRKDSISLTTRYYDHPPELLKRWVGLAAIKEAENLKLIDYEQWKSVYGGMPAKLHGGCYPKYDIENSNVSQVAMDGDYVQANYKSFYCGVDTGSTDATVFTFVGVAIRLGRVPKVGVIHRYYWKNNVSQDENGLRLIKDVNDFAKDFYGFAEKCKNYIGDKAFETQFESADPSSRIVYERYMNKRTTFCNFYTVNKKKKRDDNVKSSIQERVNFGNTVCNGADLEYNINEDTLGLSHALTDAKYNKKSERDDSGVSDIDSLDSFEYALSPIFLDLVTSTIYNYRGGK